LTSIIASVTIDVPFGEKENRIMEKQEENRIKEKLNFFYRENCKVHVSRFDKSFWRGYIISKKSDDVLNLEMINLENVCYLLLMFMM